MLVNSRRYSSGETPTNGLAVLNPARSNEFPETPVMTTPAASSFVLIFITDIKPDCRNSRTSQSPRMEPDLPVTGLGGNYAILESGLNVGPGVSFPGDRRHLRHLLCCRGILARGTSVMVLKSRNCIETNAVDT